jgi:hypothetical protein
MFMRYGYGGFGFPLWFSIIGLILFALMAGSIIWLVISLSRPGRRVRMGWYAGGGGYGPRFRHPALDELDLAYARGQVTRDEYFRRRADLTTGWGPARLRRRPRTGPPGPRRRGARSADLVVAAVGNEGEVRSRHPPTCMGLDSPVRMGFISIGGEWCVTNSSIPVFSRSTDA